MAAALSFTRSNTFGIGYQIVQEVRLSIQVGIGIGIVFFLLCVLEKINSEIGITNRRVVMSYGIIRKTTLDLFIHQVESAQMRQGILGRFLGYGDIILVGTGSTRGKYAFLTDPMKFKSALFYFLSTKNEARTAPTS